MQYLPLLCLQAKKRTSSSQTPLDVMIFNTLKRNQKLYLIDIFPLYCNPCIYYMSYPIEIYSEYSEIVYIEKSSLFIRTISRKKTQSTY